MHTTTSKLANKPLAEVRQAFHYRPDGTANGTIKAKLATSDAEHGTASGNNPVPVPAASQPVLPLPTPVLPDGKRVQLRDYQQRAIEMLYSYLKEHKGNPCIELPTGAGKSHVIAAICHGELTARPETRILMLTHVKELIEQNLSKLLSHWPGAPVGIFSAGLGRKEMGHPITYASIQSIWRRAGDIGHVDFIIIDEAHLVSHKDTGMYRTLLKSLASINPRLRIIGLTATPYRLNHGLITDTPAIFSDIIKPATLAELSAKGFLSVLRSKHTDTTYDVSGVKTRHGEFVESELEAKVNTDTLNRRVVAEIISRAEDRRHWLIFCAGIKHSQAVAEELARHGIRAACVTGETPKREREEIIANFKSGKIRALTNTNVLTTGFDYPDIDLIAMLRPTKSPGLYVQMAGRGLRVKSHTDHCLVLDFAGNVARHGPITAVTPPDKAGNGNGQAPVKKCPQCREIIAAQAKTCPACGFLFHTDDRTPQDLRLRNDDIMGNPSEVMEAVVKSWRWRTHLSRQSGKQLLACDYSLIDAPGVWLTEYFPVHHGGYASQRAWRELEEISICGLAGQPFSYVQSEPLPEIAKLWGKIPPPKRVFFTRNGKFFRVIKRVWED